MVASITPAGVLAPRGESLEESLSRRESLELEVLQGEWQECCEAREVTDNVCNSV